MDPGINTEPAKEVLKGCEKVDQCIVAGMHFFDRLGKSNVKERYSMRPEERETYGE